MIYQHLAGLPAFAKLRDSALRSLAGVVRYHRSDSNDILFWWVKLASFQPLITHFITLFCQNWSIYRRKDMD